MTKNEKKELFRKEFLGKRLGLTREEVENRSKLIIENIKSKNFLENEVFLFYVPIKNEVDLLPLAKELFLNGKTILFPRIINYERIVPYRIDDINFDFVKGAFGIPEPDTVPFYADIDLIFVPGIVFGRNGYRIGYGKSYYDVFLSSFPYRKTVGVCFDFQLVDEVPFDENDVRLNFVITESEFLTF